MMNRKLLNDPREHGTSFVVTHTTYEYSLWLLNTKPLLSKVTVSLTLIFNTSEASGNMNSHYHEDNLKVTVYCLLLALTLRQAWCDLSSHPYSLGIGPPVHSETTVTRAMSSWPGDWVGASPKGQGLWGVPGQQW